MTVSFDAPTVAEMTSLLEAGPLTAASFEGDSHAAKYLGALQSSPEAFERLLDLLNRPEVARHLTSLAPGEPALSAIVESIEGDEVIEHAVSSGPGALRFRQAVGVAVRLRMEQLGWMTTGSKGTVRRSRHFGRAERYRPRSDASAQDRALAALDDLLEIGDDAERADTGAELQRMLRETRRDAGRAF